MLVKIEGGRGRVWQKIDGWMASPIRWTWVWASSRSWWWTGKPGELQSMGSQSQTQVSNWTEMNWSLKRSKISMLCHAMLSHFRRAWLFATYELGPSRILCPWEFPGKNTGEGCRALLQGIFQTKELIPYLWCLLPCRQVLYPPSLLGSLKISIILFKHFNYNSSGSQSTEWRDWSEGRQSTSELLWEPQLR